MSGEDLRVMLVGMIARIRECEEELNTLDAELGDGDLGSTLVSVAGAVEGAFASLPNDLSAAFSQLARIIGEVSGSSFSSLLMIGLSKAGAVLAGKVIITAEDRVQAWLAALSAMFAASGARLGDKTMFDAVNVIAQAPAGANLAAEVVRTLNIFRPKACRAGRARVAGERSIGRDDPGMVAMLRLVEGATSKQAAP